MAIVPARGGSKGLTRKNILPLLGKPLIAWTIEEAKRSQYIDRLILSSEDAEIISIAKTFGCEVPFVRPLELSQDDTPGIDVVFHAIDTINSICSSAYDYVVLLQPTSPLRKATDIDICIELCVERQKPSCVSFTETDKTPYWMYFLDEKGQLQPLISIDKHVNRRQDAPTYYFINGVVYVANIEWLKKNKTFVSHETYPYIMPRERSVDIDTLFDFKLAEFLFQNQIS